MIDKVSSYSNIFECSRNLLDQLYVTYQREFTASPVQEGFYQISPARERYYDMMANKIIETNVGREGTIIPKHKPTSIYYHLVGCIAECRMRSDEYNRHVHGSYAEETAP